MFVHKQHGKLSDFEENITGTHLGCIHQLFEDQVAHREDAIALVFEDQQLTYQELNQQANQLAHYLQALEVGPEVLVGVCLERSLEMVIAMLAILKAGGAYVPPRSAVSQRSPRVYDPRC